VTIRYRLDLSDTEDARRTALLDNENHTNADRSCGPPMRVAERATETQIRSASGGGGGNRHVSEAVARK
jgi:hypothetical protein